MCVTPHPHPPERYTHYTHTHTGPAVFGNVSDVDSVFDIARNLSCVRPRERQPRQRENREGEREWGGNGERPICATLLFLSHTHTTHTMPWIGLHRHTRMCSPRRPHTHRRGVCVCVCVYVVFFLLSFSRPNPLLLFFCLSVSIRWVQRESVCVCSLPSPSLTPGSWAPRRPRPPSCTRP